MPAGWIAAIGSIVSAGSAIASGSAQRRAAREQRRLQRLQERRERTKLFAEQRRATAQVQAQLVARGASAGSAAETVPGSIATQGASNQAFLTQVGNISRSMNSALSTANTFDTIGQVAGVVGGAAKAGAFDKWLKTTPAQTTTTPVSN